MAPWPPACKTSLHLRIGLLSLVSFFPSLSPRLFSNSPFSHLKLSIFSISPLFTFLVRFFLSPSLSLACPPLLTLSSPLSRLSVLIPMSARRDPTPKLGILAILNSLGRLPVWLDTQYPQSAKAHTVPALSPDGSISCAEHTLGYSI